MRWSKALRHICQFIYLPLYFTGWLFCGAQIFAFFTGTNFCLFHEVHIFTLYTKWLATTKITVKIYLGGENNDVMLWACASVHDGSVCTATQFFIHNSTSDAFIHMVASDHRLNVKKRFSHVDLWSRPEVFARGNLIIDGCGFTTSSTGTKLQTAKISSQLFLWNFATTKISHYTISN